MNTLISYVVKFKDGQTSDFRFNTIEDAQEFANDYNKAYPSSCPALEVLVLGSEVLATVNVTPPRSST